MTTFSKSLGLSKSSGPALGRRQLIKAGGAMALAASLHSPASASAAAPDGIIRLRTRPARVPLAGAGYR